MVCGLNGHVCLLMFLYFIQGLPYGIQTHFLPVYLRTRGVDLTEISLFRLLQAPWLCKVVWAPFIDSYSTRRQWLLVTILALALSCILSAVNSPDSLTTLAVAALILCNVFASIQDVSVDAIAFSLLSADELAAGNVAQIVGYKLGAAFAGGILAMLVSVLGWNGMSFIMASIYAEAAMLVYVSPMLRNLDSNGSETSCHCHHRECECGNIDALVTNTSNCQNHLRCRQSNSVMTSQATVNHEKKQQHSCVPQKPLNKSRTLLHVFTLMRQMCNEPATVWLLIFLFIYKFGEQGALSMMPMFLLDNKVDPTELTFWTGVVGQVVSICGSLTGGWFVKSFSQMPVQFTLQQVCLLRLLPIGIQLLLIVIWNTGMLSSNVLLYSAMLSLMLLTFLSGVITTVTFTLMMEYTLNVSSEMKASHYTNLATVEVIGKLIFTSTCGYIAGLAGYRCLFLIFIILSAVVLWWIQRCPLLLNNVNVVTEQDVTLSNDDD